MLLELMNQQSILDSYFDIKPKEQKIPKVFYLNWKKSKAYPVSQATFDDELPSTLKYNYEYKIHWKEYKSYLFVYGLIDKTDDLYNYQIVNKMLITDTNFLKSQLQKAVRRQLVNVAVQTANDMIKLSISDLLRRLPIIMLEDTVLHESFSTLIWLMINIDNPKFHLTKNMVKWILGIVEMITLIDKKWEIPSLLPDEKFKILDYGLLHMNNGHSSCLHAILLRRSYGGMKCDMRFLMDCFKYYYENAENALHFSTKSKSIELTVTSMKRNDYLSCAYDFHVNPTIITIISNEHDVDNIKDLIWKFSSSINKRLLNSDVSDIDDWKKIEPIYTKLTEYYLNKLII